MYDCIIIGTGKAGMAAAAGAARHKLKTLVISKERNSAEEMSDEFLEFKDNTEVSGVEKNIVSFSVEVKSGEVYYARSIIIASGKGGSEFESIISEDLNGRIKVDANMATNVEGIFAIGGANNALDGDNLVKAGEGAKAALAVTEYLKELK